VKEVKKTARQLEIEALKKSLLQPLPGRGLPAPSNSAVGAMGGMNKIDKGDDKFSKVMDWGTPRLVTKNR